VTKWQEPWQCIPPQALNSSGKQIVYHVERDQDRMWPYESERSVDHHRAVRERDLDKLSNMHARDPRELKDGSLLRWRQELINVRKASIIAMHKSRKNGRGYSL
jgi:hypothetical protein